MLPTPPLPTGSVDIDGTPVAIRSLSRDEVVALAAFADDTAAAEVFIISRSTGAGEDEATSWRKAVTADTASTLLDAIARISGLARGEA